MACVGQPVKVDQERLLMRSDHEAIAREQESSKKSVVPHFDCNRPLVALDDRHVDTRSPCLAEGMGVSSMTREQRIKKHRETIELIREDIAWLKSSGFSITSGTMPGPSTNAQLIEAQEKHIAMYEAFIAKLTGD